MDFSECDELIICMLSQMEKDKREEPKLSEEPNGMVQSFYLQKVTFSLMDVLVGGFLKTAIFMEQGLSQLTWCMSSADLRSVTDASIYEFIEYDVILFPFVGMSFLLW